MDKNLQLVCMVGLIASGKSTAAKKMVELGGWREVNKDEIRAVMTQGGWKWSRENEIKDVIPARNAAIAEALGMEINVVSSDTNLDPRHQAELKKIAEDYGAEFIIMKFPISLDLAIERDSQRGHKAIGKKAITDMANRWRPEGAFPTRTPAPASPDPAGAPARKVYDKDGTMKMPAVIVDLDGTAAIHNGRGPYEIHKCHSDLINPMVLEVVKLLVNHKFYQVIYCSGRDDCHRTMSQAWLDHNGFPKGPLHMRVTGDKRNDGVVKTEIYQSLIEPHYDVRLVIDDRDRVIKAYRALGLTVWQVAEGDF